MKILLTILLAVFCSSFAFSQNDKAKKEIKTVEFKVYGNCEECKKRIENAAYIKGVKSTSWNEETKKLKVVFRADKVTEKQIQEAVAKSGHETETTLADEKAYSQLPDCCKYKSTDCHKK